MLATKKKTHSLTTSGKECIKEEKTTIKKSNKAIDPMKILFKSKRVSAFIFRPFRYAVFGRYTCGF